MDRFKGETARSLPEFEVWLESMLERHQVPGGSIAVSEAGELSYYTSFGYQDEKLDRKIGLDTVFGIGSVTKSFTCMAILHLQDSGKLSVHDPVTAFLPEFRLRGSQAAQQIGKITIHHLMTHTSGLPPLPTLYSAMKRSQDNDPDFQHSHQSKIKLPNDDPLDTFEQLIQYLYDLDFELLGTPGSEFSYSNDGYALLGAIIKRVSGQSYESYVQDNLLHPAGMLDSGFDPNAFAEDRLAPIYAWRMQGQSREVFHSPARRDAPVMRAAGFLYSTARDMLKYAELFRTPGRIGNRRIISEQSMKQMTTPYVQCEYNKYYGYGVMLIPDYFGSLMVEHGGTVKGVKSQLSIVPEQDLCGITLTNIASAPATRLNEAVLNSYLGRNPGECLAFSEKGDQLNSGSIEEYTGTYTSREGMSIDISSADGQLIMELNGESFALHSLGGDWYSYVQMEIPQTVHFKRNSEGNINRISCAYRQCRKADEISGCMS
ncbi:serine hydrolase [Paenibacillus senegalensis]|uniref:serine hydrolase n=1 Tax=Paenibacillus senegalensis TaxID=1465766 RepID=UPI000313E78C|nr:serine hydrolase [Paenibacillus senegalensis]